ncbi:MAG: porin [Aureibaculum sp.]|nr:porin [Aureibaculum sp.]
MKNYILITLLLVGTHSFSQETEKKENPFSAKWDNGFKVESADKNFKLKFGGRIMVDHAFFSHNDEMDQNWGSLDVTSGTEFRRTRFYMSGLVYKNVEFKLQLDFAGGITTFKDAYIGLKSIPGVGTIRVGHVKEPFRLEALTSSKYITFMERSLSINASQERNSGILLFNDFADKKIAAQLGFFRNSNAAGNNKDANNSYALTGRLTGVPYRNKGENQFSQIGVAFTNRQNPENIYSYQARPETHLGEKYISTGLITDVQKINGLNFEAIFSSGPFSIQGEYLKTNLKMGNETPVDNYDFNSYYVQAGFFITGDHRKMKSSYGGLDRLKPLKNFGKGVGAGAWEVAIRYSDANYNSEDIIGGQEQDITLGLNWYLNPVTRIMFNNVFANITDMGRVNVFQMRFQIDF